MNYHELSDHVRFVMKTKYKNDVIDRIDVVYAKKWKLGYGDQSDRVRFVIKTRQDINVIDHIGYFYAEIEIELSGPIWLSEVCDEN